MSDTYFVIGRCKAVGAGGRAAIRSLGIQGAWYLVTENPPVTLQIHGQIALPYILRAATVQQLDEEIDDPASDNAQALGRYDYSWGWVASRSSGGASTRDRLRRKFRGESNK